MKLSIPACNYTEDDNNYSQDPIKQGQDVTTMASLESQKQTEAHKNNEKITYLHDINKKYNNNSIAWAPRYWKTQCT